MPFQNIAVGLARHELRTPVYTVTTFNSVLEFGARGSPRVKKEQPRESYEERYQLPTDVRPYISS